LRKNLTLGFIVSSAHHISTIQNCDFSGLDLDKLITLRNELNKVSNHVKKYNDVRHEYVVKNGIVVTDENNYVGITLTEEQKKEREHLFKWSEEQMDTPIDINWEPIIDKNILLYMINDKQTNVTIGLLNFIECVGLLDTKSLEESE
jgi:hypothetical protein